MARRAPIASLVLALALAAAPAAPAGAAPLACTEDFRDTLLRDPVLTTAWWDTVAGELKLPPLGAVVLGTADTPDNAYAVVLLGTHALVADNASGLQVVDVASAGQPEVVGAWDSPGSARGIAVAGGHAYLADGAAGLQILDISSPSSPQPVGSLAADGFVHGLAVAGHHVYLAQSGAGLRAVDVSDPAAPSPADLLDSDGWAEDVAVAGGVAYLADGGAGLLLVDISDPDALVAAGALDTPGYARGVAVAPPLAYVADGDSGLVVVDVANAAAPVRVGRADVPGGARGVVVDGDRAYVAAGESGLQILDVSVPAAPRLLGGRGLAVADGLAYLADGAPGLRVLELAPAGYDTERNVGHSRVIDASVDPIVRASLTAAMTDSIRWELSADGGAHWQEFPPDGNWHAFAEPGDSLLWRSSHVLVDGGGNPTCSELELAWEKSLSAPQIRSVTDVPEDAGGWVRLVFAGSRFDVAGSQQPITEYAVFRRWDLDAPAPARAPAPAEKAYPPGDWDYLLSIPADAEASYAAVLPTLVDATPETGLHWTVFFVRARTAVPGTYFDSAPDSGYSQDNGLPSIPTGLTVSYGAAGNALAWDPSPDADFLEFRLYRGDDPGFPISVDCRVHVTATAAWLDPVSPGWGHHYKLTAVNASGLESVAVGPATLTGVPGPPPPTGALLLPNVPNPCNPGTEIRFRLAVAAPVRLDLYDLRGRLVRRLLRERRPAGEHAVFWAGDDGRGRRVASGVYVCVLRTPAGSRARTLAVAK